MRSSSKPAPARDPSQDIRPFPYLEAEGGEDPSTSGLPVHPGLGGSADRQRREDSAREAGRQEGEARARADHEAREQRLRGIVEKAVTDFAQDRSSYYQRVEREVVQLALSIARKILHREAQVDPVLLAGIVRVTLDKIESGTKVLLKVHPQHAAEWRNFFARSMDPHEIPEVAEDMALPPDRCVLESVLGSTELGMEIQLKEIEQGFLDLLAERPERDK